MGLGDFLFGTDAQKYDPNTQQARDARTIGGPNHAYDTTAAQSQGTQLNTGNYDRDRAQQQGLAGSLQSAANGQGPSAAGMAGQAQRDANLTQAAALQSGRRGAGAGVGIRAGNNAIVAGNQGAAQTEAVGRANEMNTARGQQAGVLAGMAGQDTAVAGQNAQLGQANNQFNAGSQNQVNQANQTAQLGISNAELQARQKQEAYSYTNLEPSQGGFFSPGNIATLAGAGATAAAGKPPTALANGGFFKKPTLAVIGEAGPEMVVPLSKGHEGMQQVAKTILSRLPHMADGGGGGMGGGSSGKLPSLPGSDKPPPPEALTIGANGAQRVNPHWGANSDAAYGQALGSVASKAILAAVMMKDGGVAGAGNMNLPELRANGPSPTVGLIGANGATHVAPNWGANSPAAFGQALGNVASKAALSKVAEHRSNDGEREQNGGVTDREALTDPKAAATKAAFQRSIADAANVGATAPRTPVAVNVAPPLPQQQPQTYPTSFGPVPAMANGGLVLPGHDRSSVGPGLMGALHDVHDRLTRLEGRGRGR